MDRTHTHTYVGWCVCVRAWMLQPHYARRQCERARVCSVSFVERFEWGWGAVQCLCVNVHACAVLIRLEIMTTASRIRVCTRTMICLCRC